MTVQVDESDQAEQVPNHVNDAHSSDLDDQPAEQVDVHFDDKELNKANDENIIDFAKIMGEIQKSLTTEDRESGRQGIRTTLKLKL